MPLLLCFAQFVTSAQQQPALTMPEAVERALDKYPAVRSSALRARGMNVASIRNHTLGEHPQSVFVRFWGEGNALQLAKAVRYALDVQVGAATPGSREKI